MDQRLYPRTYYLTASARWTIWTLGAILIVAAAAFVALPGYGASHVPAVRDLIIDGIFITLSGGLGTCLIVSGFRSRVVLAADSICVIGTLSGTRSLRRSDIRGVRSISAGIRDAKPTLELVPRFEGLPAVRITGSYETDDVFRAWMSGLANLDAVDFRASQEAIESSPALGNTMRSRHATVQTARDRIGMAAFAFAVAMVVILWIPSPPGVVIAILGALPWLGIFIVGRSGELYRLHDVKNDARLNIRPVLYVPGLVLALLALRNVHIMAWRLAGTSSILVSGVLVAAAICIGKKPRASAPSVAMLFLLSLGYGYGVVAFGDSMMDQSTPRVYHLERIGAGVSSGRGGIWRWLEFAPWGPQPGPQRTSVSSEVFEAAGRGEPVCANLRRGALRIEWYELVPCD
jgi:hypothetical protein